MTIFKILKKRKFVCAKKLENGNILYKNQIINPVAYRFVEKKALHNFNYIVSSKEKQIVYRLPWFTEYMMQKGEKKKIITKFINDKNKIYYLSSDFLLIRDDSVLKQKAPKLFQARINNPGGAPIRSCPEKFSQSIGIIHDQAMVIIESIELSLTDSLEYAKLYECDGYILKKDVRLIGYANDVDNYYPQTYLFPITFLDEKKCIICSDRLCNSVYVHGQTGHSVSCYDCASKTASYCPICRKKVEKIILLF